MPVGDDLETEADKALAEFDAAYDRERLVALVKAGGRETDRATNGRETDRGSAGLEKNMAEER